MDRSPPVSVPRLRTQRLTLREYRPEDFDAFAANLTNPAATRFLGSSDRLSAWRLFCGHAGLWLLQGAGWWTVEAREPGRAVGTVGAFFRQDLSGIEIGWITYPRYWGRGYAREAAAAAIRYALEVRGEPHVRALIDPENVRSIRVAHGLGMRHDADIDLHGKALGRYRRHP